MWSYTYTAIASQSTPNCQDTCRVSGAAISTTAGTKSLWFPVLFLAWALGWAVEDWVWWEGRGVLRNGWVPVRCWSDLPPPSLHPRWSLEWNHARGYFYCAQPPLPVPWEALMGAPDPHANLSPSPDFISWLATGLSLHTTILRAIASHGSSPVSIRDHFHLKSKRLGSWIQLAVSFSVSWTPCWGLLYRCV